MWAKVYLNFLGDATPQNQISSKSIKNAWDIHNQKFVLPKKFAKKFWQMLLTKSLKYAKFCVHRWNNARDIRDQRFVPPENVGQRSPKFLGDAIPQNP